MAKIDTDDPRIKLERGDANGPIRLMAMADGYVMVRRPGCMPWVEGLSTWVARPLESEVFRAREQYREAFGRSSI